MIIKIKYIIINSKIKILRLEICKTKKKQYFFNNSEYYFYKILINFHIIPIFF